MGFLLEASGQSLGCFDPPTNENFLTDKKQKTQNLQNTYKVIGNVLGVFRVDYGWIGALWCHIQENKYYAPDPGKVFRSRQSS